MSECRPPIELPSEAQDQPREEGLVENLQGTRCHGIRPCMCVCVKIGHTYIAYTSMLPVALQQALGQMTGLRATQQDCVQDQMHTPV